MLDTATAARPRREVKSDVLLARADCGRHAPDASIYQDQPLGVVVPARSYAASPGGIVAADGTGRRHRIADLAGRAAMPSVCVLARALAAPS